MNRKEPVGELHRGFSADDATATPWASFISCPRGSVSLTNSEE